MDNCDALKIFFRINKKDYNAVPIVHYYIFDFFWGFFSHEKAELGYWIGIPYWRMGYCTEAVKAILIYGFESLKLHRIYAVHYTENIASGKVLLKSGMRHEGSIRHAVKKWGEFKDLELYAIIN